MPIYSAGQLMNSCLATRHPTAIVIIESLLSSAFKTSLLASEAFSSCPVTGKWVTVGRSSRRACADAVGGSGAEVELCC